MNLHFVQRLQQTCIDSLVKILDAWTRATGLYNIDYAINKVVFFFTDYTCIIIVVFLCIAGTAMKLYLQKKCHQHVLTLVTVVEQWFHC